MPCVIWCSLAAVSDGAGGGAATAAGSSLDAPVEVDVEQRERRAEEGRSVGDAARLDARDRVHEPGAARG